MLNAQLSQLVRHFMQAQRNHAGLPFDNHAFIMPCQDEAHTQQVRQRVPANTQKIQPQFPIIAHSQKGQDKAINCSFVELKLTRANKEVARLLPQKSDVSMGFLTIWTESNSQPARPPLRDPNLA